MFNLFKERSRLDADPGLYASLQRIFENIGQRLQDHDAEIAALQASKADMTQEIERLKAQVKLIEHELAIAQRKSLAQKLRNKGVK